MKRIFPLISLMLLAVLATAADQDPMTGMRDETLNFFRPLSGKIVSVEGKKAMLALDPRVEVKAGMRLDAVKEGEPFYHPVTREQLGRIEVTVGKVEIEAALPEGLATARVIDGKPVEGNTVRVPGAKVKLLFSQDRTIDWYVADSYYRRLKESGRFEMIDTGIDSSEPSVVLEEARRLGADVAVLVSGKGSDEQTVLVQRLFWVPDGKPFGEAQTVLDVAYAKELRYGSEFFAVPVGAPILSFDLPFGARLIGTGDFDGDGKQEIILSTGKDIRAYRPEVELLFLWEIKGSLVDDHVWLETMDLNRNGREEVIVTSVRDTGALGRKGDSERATVEADDTAVMSTVYELQGGEFRKLWQTGHFLRRLGNGLIAQGHSNAQGFQGPVRRVEWSGGEYRFGESVTLPPGVNIYDFVLIEGPAGEKLVFAYDEKAFLHLYNEKGLRVWTSRSSTGGFLTKFRSTAPASYVEGAEWFVKDRLMARNREVLVIRRMPLAEVAKGMGFKNSRLSHFWWNGLSMDEGVLADGIPGTALDFTIAGDRLLVLNSPFLGIKFENILKGENPRVTSLSVYSLKGR